MTAPTPAPRTAIAAARTAATPGSMLTLEALHSGSNAGSNRAGNDAKPLFTGSNPVVASKIRARYGPLGDQRVFVMSGVRLE